MKPLMLRPSPPLDTFWAEAIPAHASRKIIRRLDGTRIRALSFLLSGLTIVSFGFFTHLLDMNSPFAAIRGLRADREGMYGAKLRHTAQGPTTRM
jgi:hypothetical protein